MDLNFSTFEWYVSERVSLCKTASSTGVGTGSALLNVDGNVEKYVGRYFAHIPPSGYFSRTRSKCSFTVVKPPLYCTMK